MTDRYIKIAHVAEFADKSMKSYSLMGKKIGVIKRQDGTFYAIDVACKHQGADLTEGVVVGNIATCHRHKWKYDLETGECLNHDSPPLRRYPLKMDGEHLKILLTDDGD